MDVEEYKSPQRVKTATIWPQLAQNMKNAEDTPKNLGSHKKAIHPRSPKAGGLGCTVSSVSSSNFVPAPTLNSVHSVTMPHSQTPPAKRHQKVRNPFEAALTDRLHLPLIASPSLFRPSTPQMSSTQFEWTIDEMSSLKPAHVEAHETQFHDSPDPDLEAKAQLAISSYFKEQQIVPSPVFCPLRNHRIILSELNGNTPISKPGRRIRDCSSQTELTLPPTLPPALELALKPYFQPHLAGVGVEWEKKLTGPFNNNNNWNELSLRRKLFDMQNIMLVENDTNPLVQTSCAKTEQCANTSSSSITSTAQRSAIIGKLSDSSDKSSFGSLSPISTFECLSPLNTESAKNRTMRTIDFANEIGEQLSPIHPPGMSRTNINVDNCTNNEKNNAVTETADLSQSDNKPKQKFTPERSSSPLAAYVANKNITESSAESFAVKISRLKVNSSQKLESNTMVSKVFAKELDLSINPDDTDELLEDTFDMEEMQYSQLSAISSTSSNSDTPRGKRRSASRKNLSESFSANLLNGEQDENIANCEGYTTTQKVKDMVIKKHTPFQETLVNHIISSDAFAKNIEKPPITNSSPEKNSTIFRTDSGFNEISNNNTSSSCEAMLEKAEDTDYTMTCICASPFKKD
uniref:Protein aurora borealis n=1 Tax=Glossina palpalis gambiensis TaxID=67801 RepID=A0A1B0C254_9MUSC